jgi:UDP-3-O-[3-hydroxymyristoyl] N-acetylglucosamine deacetylase
MKNQYQNTIKKTCTFEGVALHSGEYSKITLHPAPANTGIKFKRIDSNLPIDQTLIDANIKNIKASRLCTTIGNDHGLTISTIEHLMAALHALGVDNLLIDINSSEMPILDGSSILFSTRINDIGLKQLKAKRVYLKILKSIEVKRGNAFVKIKPNDQLSIDYTINYPETIVGKQNFGIRSINQSSFTSLLSYCRTFAFENQLDELKANGIIKGGSLENAVVFGKNKSLNKEGLKCKDEPVRHKVLDAIGDLYLAGNSVIGHVDAYCAGHSLMHEAVGEIFADLDNFELTTLVNESGFSTHNDRASLSSLNL